jgi:hypothetical protein
MGALPGSGSTMSPATRLSRPRRGIALLLVGIGVALVVAIGSRTTAQTSTFLPASSPDAVLALHLDATDAGDAAAVVAAEQAPSQARRQPLATPLGIVIATIVLAAVVATGLRYTITSVPDAGRATAGLRPPPLLRA